LYKFFVHVRHPSYRLVTKADVPFPSGTTGDDGQLTRSREASDVNAESRDAVDQNGYSLFRIGLLSEIPKVMAHPWQAEVSAFRAGTRYSPTRSPFD
jgi:hypothetical protein